MKLGAIYEKTNISQAIGWYINAVQKGNKDGLKALENLAKVSNPTQGNIEAINTLGSLYEEGKYVDKDVDAAVEWYKQAAMNGDEKGVKKLKFLAGLYFNTKAMNILGSIYEKGVGKLVQKNVSEASSWYRKAVELDSQQALESLQSLADAKNRDAMENLGQVYLKQRKLDLAGQCFKNADDIKSAQAPEEWKGRCAAARFLLGELYENEKQVGQAVEWYVKAGKAGNEDALAKLEELGRRDPNVMFHLGDVCAEAAKAGNREALAKLEELGKWDANAMFHLGDVYENGKEGTQSISKAVEWYQKAASKDNLDAMKRLEKIYRTGKGDVPQDLHLAEEWKLEIDKKERKLNGLSDNH
jgi:TPR repeat protein